MKINRDGKYRMTCRSVCDTHIVSGSSHSSKWASFRKRKKQLKLIIEWQRRRPIKRVFIYHFSFFFFQIFENIGYWCRLIEGALVCAHRYTERNNRWKKCENKRESKASKKERARNGEKSLKNRQQSKKQNTHETSVCIYYYNAKLACWW